MPNFCLSGEFEHPNPDYKYVFGVFRGNQMWQMNSRELIAHDRDEFNEIGTLFCKPHYETEEVYWSGSYKCDVPFLFNHNHRDVTDALQIVALHRNHLPLFAVSLPNAS